MNELNEGDFAPEFITEKEYMEQESACLEDMDHEESEIAEELSVPPCNDGYY
jgi:hypothetical protein